MFEQVIFVDWSAANRPRKGNDSIWIATSSVKGGHELINVATRDGAYKELFMLIMAALKKNVSVLVGFDFSFGYSSGFARALSGVGEPWMKLWKLYYEQVKDDDCNNNNRFSVAESLNRAFGASLFWGTTSPTKYLKPKKQDPFSCLTKNPFAEFRLTETLARRQAGKAIKSNWQLYGGVTVGSQTIMGIPYVEKLRREFGKHLNVWPFQTGFSRSPFEVNSNCKVVVAEIWPTLFTRNSSTQLSESRIRNYVKDASLLLNAVKCIMRVQQNREIESWFNPSSLLSEDPQRRLEIETEEGWILGVK